MNAKEILLDCMDYYQLPVLEQRDHIITTIKGYDIEVEANGVYKLQCSGQVVAPFNNLDELCNFIINS